MGYGLDKLSRIIIRGMISGRIDEEKIIEEIHRLTKSGGYDYEENIKLLKELAAAGYSRAAEALKNDLER